MISCSSVETFIEKENIVAYIVACCKVIRLNSKYSHDINYDPVKCSYGNIISENLLKIIQLKGNLQEQLMNNESRKCFSHNNSIRYQPRTEYYNDFEICLREYKNQKIKSLQKQTKVHLSDGDGSGSDSDYVDASSELKYQSTTSKSTSHVPTVHQQKQSLTKPTTKPNTITNTEFNDDVRATARIINQQSNICYDNLQQPQQQQQPIMKCSNNWHEMPQPPLPSSQNIFKIVPLNVNDNSNDKMDTTSSSSSNINNANQTINKNQNNDVLSIVMTTPVRENSRKSKTECNNILVSPVVTPKHKCLETQNEAQMKRSSSKKTNELINSPTGRSKNTTEETSQKNLIKVYDKRATATSNTTITSTTTNKPEKRADVGSASQKQIQR